MEESCEVILEDVMPQIDQSSTEGGVCRLVHS